MESPIASAPHKSGSPASDHGHRSLRRILGTFTVVCVGVGGAIGSGIFRTPGEVAEYVRSPWMILALWLLAGGITLMQSLVNAELATRFPQAGGEYQYLKHAYGPFAAFFFGWSCTIFIIGAGAGTIAAALGDFAAELVGRESGRASAVFGCIAIAAVTLVNVMGLRAGAAAQILLTVLKAGALLAIGMGAWILSGNALPAPNPPAVEPPQVGGFTALMLGLLPVFWSYTGATDAVRLAEEVKDVHRALPRALIATVLILTLVYLLYNYALMCALSPAEMAGQADVHALAFGQVEGSPVRAVILLISILICLGSISAVFLANVRVTYALARDGLTFRFLAQMSERQAPIASFLVVGLIACSFVLQRGFGEILRIYFLASAFLFGLTYLSLIVFRLRNSSEKKPFPPEAYRAPAGILLAVLLILFEVAIGGSIVWSDWRDGSYDSLLTLALLAGMALFYIVWKRFHPAVGRL